MSGNAPIPPGSISLDWLRSTIEESIKFFGFDHTKSEIKDMIDYHISGVVRKSVKIARKPHSTFQVHFETESPAGYYCFSGTIA